MKAIGKSWARLIQKICAADPLICPKCQGKIRVIGGIEDPSFIRAMLEHLGLWLARARPPPIFDENYPLTTENTTTMLRAVRSNVLVRQVIEGS